MINKHKGMELPFSKIVVLILAVLAVLFMLGAVFNVWGNLEPSISDQQLYGECANWASEEEPYNKESFNDGDYPALDKTYDGNYVDAKTFCKQET